MRYGLHSHQYISKSHLFLLLPNDSWCRHALIWHTQILDVTPLQLDTQFPLNTVQGCVNQQLLEPRVLQERGRRRCPTVLLTSQLVRITHCLSLLECFWMKHSIIHPTLLLGCVGGNTILIITLSIHLRLSPLIPPVSPHCPSPHLCRHPLSEG